MGFWFWLAIIIVSQGTAYIFRRQLIGPPPYSFPECRRKGCHLFTDGVEYCLGCGKEKPLPQLPVAKVIRLQEHKDFLGYDEDGP